MLELQARPYPPTQYIFTQKNQLPCGFLAPHFGQKNTGRRVYSWDLGFMTHASAYIAAVLAWILAVKNMIRTFPPGDSDMCSSSSFYNGLLYKILIFNQTIFGKIYIFCPSSSMC
jgi:hypothetical protein